MDLFVLVVCAMAAAVLVVGLGERLRLPWPALMVLSGVGAAAIPGVASVRVDPELILPLLLPPLLFATAQRTSWALFRTRWRAILFLAVLLTAATIGAVAGAAAAIVPGLTVTAAVALAAAVAPPDPVAVEAVAGPSRMPNRLLTVLRSEGLFNDAVALVAFQAALAALADGSTFGPPVLLGFVYGLVVAVGLGFAAAWVHARVRVLLTNASGRNALTLVLPFGVYLGAEAFGASGVIAVVVAALQIRARDDAGAGEERLTGRAFWDVIELLVTGVAFGLVGVELRVAVGAAGSELPRMLLHAAIVCGVVVGVRASWMTVAALTMRTDEREDAPRSAAEWVVLTWCGMRGLVTLALALALPTTVAGGTPFPARTELIVIACSVIVVTLLVPAFTLRTAMRVLGVTASADAERVAEEPIITLARRAAAAAVRDPALSETEDADAAGRKADVFDRINALLDDGPDSDGYQERRDALRRRQESERRVDRLAVNAARSEVLAARRRPGTDPEAADRVLRRLDQRLPGSD